jgi:hypothetical protein
VPKVENHNNTEDSRQNTESKTHKPTTKTRKDENTKEEECIVGKLIVNAIFGGTDKRSLSVAIKP